jgi:hypothetical protein
MHTHVLYIMPHAVAFITIMFHPQVAEHLQALGKRVGIHIAALFGGIAQDQHNISAELLLLLLYAALGRLLSTCKRWAST